MIDSAPKDLNRPSSRWRLLWCVLAIVLAVGAWGCVVLATLEFRAFPLWALGLWVAGVFGVLALCARNRREPRTAALVAAGTVLAMVVSAHVPGGVTQSDFGFTIIGLCPLPAVDVSVRAGGAVWLRPKSHRVSWAEIEPIARGAERVIIATGWQDAVSVNADVRSHLGARLEERVTPDAVARYTALRRAGVRVVLLLHSTC